MTGIELIAAERKRQVEVEGFTTERDVKLYPTGQLVAAALCYADAPFWHSRWPWSSDWWKPSTDPIRNLVKAGALIAAEIDRLQSSMPSAVHISLDSSKVFD